MSVWPISNSRLYYFRQRFILQMIILILALPLYTKCYPINNGFTLKFTPLSVRDEIKENAETHGSKFTKIPQKDDRDSKSWNQVLAEPDIFADMLRNGNTNQIAKLLLPTTRRKNHVSDEQAPSPQPNTFITGDEDKTSFLMTNEPDLKTNFLIQPQPTNLNRNFMMNDNINLPLLKQPHTTYKMLIATSPPNFRLGDSEQPILIYIVFPEDESGSSEHSSIIPTVYFVKQTKVKQGKRDEPIDPIFIVDQNRTVTGIKSRGVPKYLTFRSKYLSKKEHSSL